MGAIVLGAHLEGPFISPKAIGAQNPNFLIPPTLDNFNAMVGDAEDAVVSITIAPEVPGAKELIKELSKKGYERSLQFSWRQTAIKTLEAYKEISKH